jgi:NAD(P)H-dependent FMN reductase
MLTADGLIFVSPVYVSQVTGLMKNFIDRFSYLCHRPALFEQDMLAISTTGVMGLKDVLGYLADVAGTWDIRSVTKLGLVTPPGKTEDEIKNDDSIAKAAKQFYKKLSREKWSPSLNQVIQFNAQKTFLTSQQASKYSPKDFQHYQKLKHEIYNVPVKINLFKQAIGKLVALMLKISSKN